MASVPTFLVYFTSPTTLVDAARRLSRRMHVVEEDDCFTAQWAPGRQPELTVSLNTESWVIEEATENAEERNLPVLASLITFALTTTGPVMPSTVNGSVYIGRHFRYVDVFPDSHLIVGPTHAPSRCLRSTTQ